MPEEQNHQTGEWKTFLLILLSPNAWIGFLVATFITMLVIGVVTYYCCIIKKKLLSVIPFHKKPTSCFSHMNIPRVLLLCGVGLAQIVDGQDYSHICETPDDQSVCGRGVELTVCGHGGELIHGTTTACGSSPTATDRVVGNPGIEQIGLSTHSINRTNGIDQIAEVVFKVDAEKEVNLLGPPPTR